MFNIEHFISETITHRGSSLFEADLEANRGALAREIGGRSVLVIGGAGSIGSSFIKALLRYEPARLVVADLSENGLAELTRDLRSSCGLKVPDVYLTYPVDFGDRVFERIFRERGPFDIVANFAAHKHVRSEKDEYSIMALLRNNIIKAEKLLDLLKFSPPGHFFCVSTDKAANPVNIMGASKKVMEELIMAYSDHFPVTTARFANVAFSGGSLPDGFINRILKRQPLSAPSDVKRYFVSPEESGQICLLACILGQSGDIFFPRLAREQMMTFSDIAVNLLRYLGYEPAICGTEEEARKMAEDMRLNSYDSPINPDNLQPTTYNLQPTTYNLQPTTYNLQPTTANRQLYPLYLFTSDTSGEKPFEEFFTGGEETDMQSFTALGVIKNAPRRGIAEMRELTLRLEEVLNRPGITKAGIVEVLNGFLPGFRHIETGKNLDQRM